MALNDLREFYFALLAERNTRMEFPTAISATPTSAKTAPHKLAMPAKPSIITATLTLIENIIFWLAIL